MHILLIHQVFITPEHGGGTRHYELARYLVKKGHRVTVITGDIDYLSGKRKMIKTDTKEGIEIIYANTFREVHESFLDRALCFISFTMTAFYRSLKISDVDAVWGTSPPLVQSIAALLIAKIKRKPFVFEVRDLWIDFAAELGIVKNRLLIRCLKVIEKIIYRLSDRIIVNSPGFIPFIERQVKRKNMISLVPNGVTTKDFDIKNDSESGFRARTGLKNKFIAVYLGNTGMANDLETVIDAAEKLQKHSNILFIIMGGGIKKKELENLIFIKGLDNIVLLDPRPKSEIPGILAEVDVCLATLKDIPLFNTPYPNKVFDYMAAQKPTVLAIDGAIREVIESSEGGTYVKPGDSSALAEAVLEYCRNPELRLKHGNNAGTYVRKHFERDSIAEKFEDILTCLTDKYSNSKKTGSSTKIDIKRIFDLTATIAGLSVISPAILFIALMVRIFIGSPVLFRQERPGLHGKPFYIFKFRTMTDSKDRDGNLLPDGERLTRLGRFLRKNSLDELPELLNVIKGDMSLVGPRPLLMKYMTRYTPEQAGRHNAKPGITGWAQIQGRNTISWEEKFRHDLWYVENQGLLLDIRILLITMWKVLKREGINHTGEATMKEFRGFQYEVRNDDTENINEFNS